MTSATTIPGYRYGDPSLPRGPLGADDLDRMKQACTFGDEDVAALRRSGPVLEPRIEEILDVWYGFIGGHDFLLAAFVDPATGAPAPGYLDRVRARFGQWIRDTAAAKFDASWLAWQLEIGRRHHRVGKNATDGVRAAPVVPLSTILLVAQPVVDTLRPFLAADGASRDEVDARHGAWRKAVLLQTTLWAYPYVDPADF